MCRAARKPFRFFLATSSGATAAAEAAKEKAPKAEQQSGWTDEIVEGLLDDSLRQFERGIKMSAGHVHTARIYGKESQKGKGLKDKSGYYRFYGNQEHGQSGRLGEATAGCHGLL